MGKMDERPVELGAGLRGRAHVRADGGDRGQRATDVPGLLSDSARHL